MTLLRFDPFGGLERWNDPMWGRARTPGMPFDAYRRAHKLVLAFDLPGIDPSSIDLTVEKGSLTVSAERPSARHEGDEVIVHERPSGRFTRRLHLGNGLDTAEAHADYDNGVLTVVVPVADEVRPRRVEVRAARSASAIDSDTVPGDGTDPAHGTDAAEMAA